MNAIQCPAEQADRIRQALGKDFPPIGEISNLERLPLECAQDAERVYRKWGSITAAYFLASSTGASLADIKLYLDSRKWHSSAE